MLTDLKALAEEFTELWEDYGLEIARSTPATAPATLSLVVARLPVSESRAVLFVGESDENPFEGKARDLFAKMVEAMGFLPENLTLTETTSLESPTDTTECIVAFGNRVSVLLVGHVTSFEKLRGSFHPLQSDPNTPVLVTFSPFFLLSHPQSKKTAWEDLKLLLKRLGK